MGNGNHTDIEIGSGSPANAAVRRRGRVDHVDLVLVMEQAKLAKASHIACLVSQPVPYIT